MILARHFTPQEILIQAPPPLVWEMLAATGHGRLPGSPNRARVVEQRSDQAALIEFISPNNGKLLTTLEEVTFYPPDRITFQHLTGPLPYVWEEFRLAPEGAHTRLSYRGTYRAPYGPLGWLIGPVIIQPIADRLVREHMEEVQHAAEARYARSHVYPRAARA